MYSAVEVTQPVVPSRVSLEIAVEQSITLARFEAACRVSLPCKTSFAAPTPLTRNMKTVPAKSKLIHSYFSIPKHVYNVAIILGCDTPFPKMD